MSDAHRFAVDVYHIICRRFEEKAADVRLMAETGISFEAWLNWEAYLACKLQQSAYPFCEVTAKPPYGGANGEEVKDKNGNPCLKHGDLRVGATYEKGDHRWVFAEFAVLHDGNQQGDKWRRRIEKDVSRLKRLGWVNSISMLVLVAVSQSDVLKTWGESLERLDVWNRPALTEPFHFSLPDGGSLLVKAFDVKQREEDVRSY
ncbi:MAG: hypothetical protein U0791_09910 [Gemmataceae bacterium]